MNRPPRQPRTRAMSSFSRSNSIGEIVSLFIASIVGATLNVILKRFWRSSFGSYAPTNPARPGVKWSDALLWGVVAGTISGVVRILSRSLTSLFRRRY